jgi:hypothetical protein
MTWWETKVVSILYLSGSKIGKMFMSGETKNKLPHLTGLQEEPGQTLRKLMQKQHLSVDLRESEKHPLAGSFASISGLRSWK